MSGEILGTNLFGDPVYPRKEGRGRPEHQWSRELSNRVLIAFALGRSVKQAAMAIGVSAPTLRKVYFSECEMRQAARERMEITQLTRLNAAAEAGNVAAEKELAKQIERLRTRELSYKMAGRQSAAEPKAAPKGKKAQQKEAAAGVKGRFAPPDPPPMIQ